MIARFPATCIVLLGGLALAGPVWAHAHLKAATPLDGTPASSLITPISLTFTEGLESAYSTIAVSDQAGRPVPTAPASVGGKDATKLYVVPTKPLAPGVYIVDWHVLSK